VIFETRASPACLHRKKAQYYVRPLATHPTAPPRFSSIDHGHRPKKRYLETDEDAVKQSKNASQTRQCSSLGDWNAGKEDDSLPGPNFDVPRDLFMRNDESENASSSSFVM